MNITILKNKIQNRIIFLYFESISRFYYSNRYFYQYLLRNYYRRRAKSIIKKNEPKLYNIISDLIKIVASSENDALSFWGDAYFLLNQTLKLKPKKILECGSGISSVVLAYVCQKLEEENNISSRIISIDENKDYIHNLLIPNIPSDFQKFIHFIYSDLQLHEYENDAGYKAIGISFKEMNFQTYDLVYIDAPQFKRGVYNHEMNFLNSVKLQKKPFDSDVLNLLATQKGNCTIIIDQRIDTVWKLKKFIGFPNSWKYKFLSKKTIFNFIGKYKYFQSTML